MLISDFHLRILKRFIFLMIPYSLLRIGFYFYHLNIYKQFAEDEVFKSFLLGLRFDVAAICLLNVPIVLLSLIPSHNKKFFTFERVLFIFINFAGLVASVDDYELFLFMGKRLSFDFFVITDDILTQLPQIFLYYWYLPVTAILFCIGFYFFDRKYFTVKNRPVSLPKFIFSSVIVVAFTFIGIRGGLQHKSINVQSAFTQGKNELGHLVLNTPYHFLRTLKNKSQSKINFFKNDEEALTIILNNRDLRASKTSLGQKNIVILIMESFSSEYLEQGYMPFLESLKNEAVYFPYHLANGRRSIEALPSLLCGLPSLLDEPLSKSIFQSNKFICMPELLKEKGYTNYFFHGGAKGTMGFEAYTLSKGFHRYFSKADYKKAGDDDGTWGIYDGPFLNFVHEELNKTKEPFLAGVFTLSSHQPYSVPLEFKNKFPKGTLEIHESIGYADHALKEFITKSRNEAWFKNTIFIITADHTSKLETAKYQNVIGQYRVPLFIFRGDSEKIEMITEKVTQHSDIPKTILELLGIASDVLPATAASLLSTDKGYALIYADGQEHLLVSLDESYGLNREKKQRKFQYDWETGRIINSEASSDLLLQAYLQYFTNGLINNNLSIYR